MKMWLPQAVVEFSDCVYRTGLPYETIPMMLGTNDRSARFLRMV